MPDGISKVTSAIIIAIVVIAIVGGVVYWYYSSQKSPVDGKDRAFHKQSRQPILRDAREWVYGSRERA